MRTTCTGDTGMAWATQAHNMFELRRRVFAVRLCARSDVRCAILTRPGAIRPHVWSTVWSSPTRPLAPVRTAPPCEEERRAVRGGAGAAGGKIICIVRATARVKITRSCPSDSSDSGKSSLLRDASSVEDALIARTLKRKRLRSTPSRRARRSRLPVQCELKP